MNVLNQWLQAICAELSPEKLDELTEKHRIIPTFPSPWVKNHTGGSDDHSSLHIARKYTQVDEAPDFRIFWKSLIREQPQSGGAPPPL